LKEVRYLLVWGAACVCPQFGSCSVLEFGSGQHLTEKQSSELQHCHNPLPNTPEPSQKKHIFDKLFRNRTPVVSHHKDNNTNGRKKKT